MSNLGFISARFSGNDGVSLESAKWAEVFENSGHKSYWFAGKLDTPPEQSMLVSESFVEHPDVEWSTSRVWNSLTRSKETTRRINALTRKIKNALYPFVKKFNIDI